MPGQLERIAGGGIAPDEGPISADLLPMTADAGGDGRLRVGGVDLVALAEDAGTPLFVYDEDHLRARCKEAVARRLHRR